MRKPDGGKFDETISFKWNSQPCDDEQQLTFANVNKLDLHSLEESLKKKFSPESQQRPKYLGGVVKSLASFIFSFSSSSQFGAC